MKRKHVRVGGLVQMRTGPDQRPLKIRAMVGTGVLVEFPDGSRLVKQLSSLERVKEHIDGSETRNPDGDQR